MQMKKAAGRGYGSPSIPLSSKTGSLSAAEVLAHIVAKKYRNHLPLSWQEQIYQQHHGVHLPRQSSTRWVELASDW